ncbi:hypothetical protein EJB05_24247, partial [Eragrostis curvula]
MSLSKAIGVVSGINEFGNFFHLVKQAVLNLRSQWSGTHEQQIQEHEVLQLQIDLRDLSETLPAMYNLIDRAEWRSHVHCVAELIPKLKDAVYDAEDLLDEFKWYELKASVEGNATQVSPPFIGFFRSVTQGSFNKVTNIQRRLSNVSSQLDKMGLHEVTPRFDKSVRPVTTSFPTEAKIIGRKNEMKELLRWLGVPNSSKRQRTCDESTSLSVLPVVGMGGIGKTTVVQEIASHPKVKSHFDKIIWICVSDDFNAERFTEVLIKSLSGKEATTDNFDDLQKDLRAEVGKKSFLLILDDIWPDALKEDGLFWRKFFAPLSIAHQKSRLLVTTRFMEVANTVRTVDEPLALEGLKPEVFWNFFKLCVFGSEDSPIDSQLKLIGENICKNLKGSPLAAKTIGRLLRQSINTKHWNDILNSELWQLKQKETDILPALRLSYMYLPFHLKRCFSFCAVYPKDYNFKKASLAEIWVVEGFVEPQGSIPLQHIGEQYFEDLLSLSFFQKLRGTYVIHDLIHDMAQLVSKDECFIAKTRCDYAKVPQNVRHLSILAGNDTHDHNIFISMGKHTKLRTLLCNKSLRHKYFDSVLNHWFSKFRCLRVISLASTRKLAESISNLKHLRYLEISRACPFRSLPSSACFLYHLQILYARKCKFESLPKGMSKLTNLRKIEVHPHGHAIEVEAQWLEKKFWWTNINDTTKVLILYNLGAISTDQAADIGVWKMEHLNNLTLRWSSLRSKEDNEIEVLQGLRAPTTLKFVHLMGYPGEYLPSWFRPGNLPTLTSPSPWSRGCGGPEVNRNQNEVPAELVDTNGRSGGIFSSLTEIRIVACQNLSSFELFLEPAYIPAVKKIVLENCQRLISLPTAQLGDLRCLEELTVSDCPNITSQSLLTESLKKLELKNSGCLGDNIDCCSLSYLHLSSSNLMSIQIERWSLPALRKLEIVRCDSLTFVGGRIGTIFISLTELSIEGCEMLSSLEQFLHPDCVPAIKKIVFENCQSLSLQSAKFEDLSCFEELKGNARGSASLSSFHRKVSCFFLSSTKTAALPLFHLRVPHLPKRKTGCRRLR